MRSRALRSNGKMIPTVVDLDDGLHAALYAIGDLHGLSLEDTIRKLLHHGINLPSSTLKNVLRRPIPQPTDDQ